MTVLYGIVTDLIVFYCRSALLIRRMCSLPSMSHLAASWHQHSHTDPGIQCYFRPGVIMSDKDYHGAIVISQAVGAIIRAG